MSQLTIFYWPQGVFRASFKQIRKNIFSAKIWKKRQGLFSSNIAKDATSQYLSFVGPLGVFRVI